MYHESFKPLRRALPIHGAKIEWAKSYEKTCNKLKNKL